MSRKFIYTNKKQSYKGIMSTLLGLINLVSIWYAVYSTYNAGGEATIRLACACVLVVVLALIGLILGLVAKNEVDRFYLFAYMGMILNLLAFFAISGILYAGAYGL